MCVKAITIDDAGKDDLMWRVLREILGDATAPGVRRASFPQIAQQLKCSVELVRYHARRLVKLGYIRSTMGGYEPTEKVLFLDFPAS